MPVCDGYEDHSMVVVFSRPWYRLFRKVYWIRCWFCDLKVGHD
jgi:hypothetical protein